MSPAHAVTHERFDEENEDRFELAGNVGYAAAVDQGHRVWILELWVHPDRRGQGCGTALLEAVISHYAGRPLALSAEPITMTNYEPAGPSADHLAAWYTRHGFQRSSGHRMTRFPGSDRASIRGDRALYSPSPPGTRPAATAPGPQPASEEPFTYHHAKYDGGVHWFSAEHDGEEIAHAHVLEKQDPGGRHVEIKTLRTNPHYRRQGIGSRLIDEVANHFPGLDLRLKPYPIDEDGTQTTEDIEEFYADRGFDRYQRKDGDPWWLGDYMTRPASSKSAAASAAAAATGRPAQRRSAVNQDLDPAAASFPGATAAAGFLETPPGLAAGPEFPKAPLATPAVSPGRRSVGTVNTPFAGQARPGRPR